MLQQKTKFLVQFQMPTAPKGTKYFGYFKIYSSVGVKSRLNCDESPQSGHTGSLFDDVDIVPFDAPYFHPSPW